MKQNKIKQGPWLPQKKDFAKVPQAASNPMGCYQSSHRASVASASKEVFALWTQKQSFRENPII